MHLCLVVSPDSDSDSKGDIGEAVTTIHEDGSFMAFDLPGSASSFGRVDSKIGGRGGGTQSSQLALLQPFVPRLVRAAESGRMGTGLGREYAMNSEWGRLDKSGQALPCSFLFLR